MDTPEPLTAAQAQYAAALPDAEQEQFACMSSADRDDLLAVMGWMAPALVEARQDDLAAARDVVAEQRRQDDRPGGYWPRNPETAPHPELERAELDALLAADDTAIDQALAALDQLLTRAARHKDLARRSRQLARVDRALADPGKRDPQAPQAAPLEHAPRAPRRRCASRAARSRSRRRNTAHVRAPRRAAQPALREPRNADGARPGPGRADPARCRRQGTPGGRAHRSPCRGASPRPRRCSPRTPATIAEREGVSRQRVVAAIRAANQAAETAA